MPSSKGTIRWPLLLVAVIGIAAAFWVGQRLVIIDSDIMASIPKDDPVLADAVHVLRRNPSMDRIVIDLSLEGRPADPQPDRLVAAANLINKRLEQSGLFARVGIGFDSGTAARLYGAVLDNLPALFSEQELRGQVLKLLRPSRVRKLLDERHAELAQLGGLGQAEALSKDPLGLRDLVLARLANLMPAATKVHVYRDHLLTADNQHLLLIAMPSAAGSDTAMARRLVRLFSELSDSVNESKVRGGDARVVLTVAGGFRAALDNETMVRGDMNKAMVLVTIGIALLLILCFPRPLIGLLALLPAGAGMALALLVYSLIEPRISALALGFGGALVSITVDHGIAYLMFLDRTTETTGKRAAQQIWSVGLFAVLTTVGAFLMLRFSGFPILEQVGLIAALGITLSFCFVHLVFPLIFPRMPAARRAPWVSIQPLLGRLTVGRGWWGPALAGLLVLVMLPFARPEFNVDLNSMNSVSRETLRAENHMKKVWGDVFNLVYLLLEGKDVDELQRKGDTLASFLEQQRRSEQITGGFSPSMLMPGPRRSRENYAAWQRFWTPKRQAALRETMGQAGQELGFTPEAFAPFFASLKRPAARPVPIPGELHEFFGISRSRSGTEHLWIGSIKRGRAYDADRFSRIASDSGIKVLDTTLFTRRLGDYLSTTFIRMLVLIALSVVVLLAVLFFDGWLVLLSLSPLGFALVCTLGTLKLIGHPIDIPGLMLVIVVFGMGIDYSLFLVRSHQRFLSATHPSQGPIRTAVFLAASSTLIGMVTLTTAQHNVFRSAGVTAALGVAYSSVGAFLILPPILQRLFTARHTTGGDKQRSPGGRRARVVRRYRHLEPYVRLSAWFKLRLDPMFPDLADLLGTAENVIDVGCGHGIPGAWLLETFPELRIEAIEPDPDRARIAQWVLGQRATVTVSGAPSLPLEQSHADAALMLDVVHHLSDEELEQTLRTLHGSLVPGGRLIIRATVPSDKRYPWERRLEELRLRLAGTIAVFRSADELTKRLVTAGFEVQTVRPAAENREETWFVALAAAEVGEE